MRKYIALLAATSFIVGSSLNGATAASSTAPKVGSTCKKVGAFIGTPTTRYVCNQEGKKKVWRVWINKSASGSETPAPKKSATAVPKKVAFKARIPITLPIAQSTDANAITFENITTRISDIPKTAWQRTQDVIASNNDAAVKHDIYIGPNTQLTTTGGIARIDEILEKGARLWSGFTLTKYFSLVYYNLTDLKWAEEKTKEIWKTKKYEPNSIGSALNALKISCQAWVSPGKGGAQLSYCAGGDAGAVTNSDDSAGRFAVGDIERPDTSGSILAHEFIHTVQASQWIGNADCKNEGNNCFRSGLVHSFSPCWIHEGLPNGTNTMIAHSDYSSYLAQRSTRRDTSQTVTDYSADSLRSYLYDQSPKTCYQNGALYQLGYDVGARAIEALVAIGGPQATMALFALGAEGQDFATAFKNVYGISWSEGSTILSKVLAAQYVS